jgi:hypothetical protein
LDIQTLSKLHGRAKLEYIASYIDKARTPEMGASEIIRYRRNGEVYHNLYALIPSENMTAYSVAITAHHDVANAESENCLDNNASVYNLAQIHNRLARQGVNEDIIIAFTDAEETCNPTINGVSELLLSYDPDYLVDLELSASGDHIISTQYGRFDLFRYNDIRQPYNNAKAAWSVAPNLGLKLRGASCVAMVSDEDLLELNKGKYCKRWGTCHSKDDTFERWMRPLDMIRFQDEICSHFSLESSLV